MLCFRICLLSRILYDYHTQEIVELHLAGCSCVSTDLLMLGGNSGASHVLVYLLGQLREETDSNNIARSTEQQPAA